jgi:hypothetical protein
MERTLHHAGESITLAPADDLDAVIQAALARLGPWVPGVSRVDVTPDLAPLTGSALGNSGMGVALVHDQAAAERIGTMQAALGVDSSRQLYATGTRMADVGYATQAGRATEHAGKGLARDVAAELTERIKAEGRREIIVKAGDLAGTVTLDGKLRILDGFAIGDQAVRGLLARVESPATGYAFGLRDRIADPGTSPAGRKADRQTLGELLRYELGRMGDAECKVRVRDSLGDVYAVVSPSYGIADAPVTLPELLAQLPADARASYSYDPKSTAWQLRASVWTPTPVDEQAVGEPFEGYSAFGGRDNGTGPLYGGGGINLLACLNAMIYCAALTSTRRVHRANVTVDLARMARDAVASITKLCEAWGRARIDVLPVPARDAQGRPLTLDTVRAAYWRAALTDRLGGLVGVLPGRREDRVAELVKVQRSESRNKAELVRADFGQAWSRMIQSEPADVRRNAEAAGGAWMASARPMRLEFARV